MTRWVAATLLGMLSVASCASSQEANDADVEFATSMIEHHAQAVEMANYTIGREGLDPRIASLAEHVRVGQTREIDTLSGWLQEWGEPVPETGFATGDSHSHSEDSGTPDEHAGLPGMMSGDELDALAAAPDAKFEARWLAMMIEHHRGAVAMAADVAEAGDSAEVAELAESIKADQQGEIARMRDWLGGA